MSKAFTKEGENDGVDDVAPVDEWPNGVKNYLTPAGLADLRLRIDAEREAAHGDARTKLVHEQRLAALLRRLEAAEVIDPATQPRDVARFGATISTRNDAGRERRWRIVGVDEADPRRGCISWRSPVAAALTGRRVGDVATVHTPTGDEELEIVAIEYE